MNHSVRNNRSVNRLFSAMTGTILKRNNDDTIHLIGTATSWILEDTSTGKIIDETTDFNQKDKWIRDYKLNKNVGQFWHKEDIKSSHKVIKSARNFDDVESQILFDNIVGGQDEMFFDWYSEKYGDIPWDNMKSIPKDRIAEYVNENPDVLADMEYEISLSYDDYAAGNTQDKNVNEFLNSSKSARSHVFSDYFTGDPIKEIDRSDKGYSLYEYDDGYIVGVTGKRLTLGNYVEVSKNLPNLEEIFKEWNERYGVSLKGNHSNSYKSGYLDNSKTIKSSITIDDKFEEYVDSDLFAERYGYDDYRADRLIEMGFSPEEIEFEWDSPKIQRALNKINKELKCDEFGNLSKNYYEWAAKILENDESYKQWRDNYGEGNAFESFQEGMNAYLQNKSLSSCPYKIGTLTAKEWENGWYYEKSKH